MSKINIEVNRAYHGGSRIFSSGGVNNLYHYEMRATKVHALMVTDVEHFEMDDCLVNELFMRFIAIEKQHSDLEFGVWYENIKYIRTEILENFILILQLFIYILSV